MCNSTTISCEHTVIKIPLIEGYFIVKCPVHGIVGIFTSTPIIHKTYDIEIVDMNGIFRTLTVRFDDGVEEEIRMNNVGPSSKYVSQYEWICNGKWTKFD